MEKKKKFRARIFIISLISEIKIFGFNVRKSLFGFSYALNSLRWVDKVTLKKILIRNGAIIGKNCDIETGSTFTNCKDFSNLIIGNNVHIGKNCFFDLRDKIIIEDNVVISMHCLLITHIDLSHSSLSNSFLKSSGEVHIGKHSYIGANCTLLMSVRCQDHSFIAAGAVVTTNTQSKTMFAGVPAKMIKKL